MRTTDFRLFRFMLLALVVCSASPSSGRGDFSEDQFPQQTNILAQLVASAEASGGPLAASLSENTAYYLRRAEYIGGCEAPFGRVHIAQLFFIRSAPKGSMLPARGHTFVAFFDTSLKLRCYWEVDLSPLALLKLDDTKLLLNGEMLMDFANPSEHAEIIVEGVPQKVPHWTSPK